MSILERITAKLRALFAPPCCPPKMDPPGPAELCLTEWAETGEEEHAGFRTRLS